ncbi:hypothetical protein [Rothia terrae]|uniref:hypothetical protein n=1 Tax=Rothia terrae TaxID=396015 RepID=UPI0028815386|nr:hypothetical protein [Rothia terrae]MDT0190761.1 hypothetical protein [Rothia terrae]
MQQLLDLVVNKIMEKKTVPAEQTKKQKIFSIIGLCVALLIFGGYPLMNKYREANPIDRQCTIESAEVFNDSSGTRGISTSGTELKINTTDCGTIYVDHSVTPKKSYQDMADELNQYQGQRVTLIFPPFQLPGTRDTVLTGYGYRL